jgi:gas vesicle protein
MKNNTKLIINFVTGLAIGAIAGILVAPSEGRSSRRKVDLFFTNFGDTIKDNAENQYNLLDNLAAGVKYAIKERRSEKTARHRS